MRKLFALAAFAAASFFAGPAIADPTIVLSSGASGSSVGSLYSLGLGTGGTTITGVNDVGVGIGSYNATFVDGSCTGLFGGCTNMTFTTQAEADGAAIALLVALRGVDPSTISGCAATTQCDIYVPYVNLGANVGAAAARFGTSGSTIFNNTFDISGNLGSAPYAGTVYARFTAAIPAAVPEPATWAMMLLGFGAIGIATRRKHTGAPVTA